jgi:hypothetical protein
LSKIEGDLLTGEVLYHKDVVKDAEEILRLKKKRADRRVKKEQRKKIQEENVAKRKLKLNDRRQQVDVNSSSLIRKNDSLKKLMNHEDKHQIRNFLKMQINQIPENVLQ